MVWQLDIQSKNGGSTVATDVPFHNLRATKTIEGPGSMEVDLTENQIEDFFQAGTHRAVLSGPMNFAGYITHLSRAGRPSEGGILYTASVLGLSSVLDWRIVRHQQNYVDEHASVIVFGLLDEIQDQYNGNLNFNHGTVHGVTSVLTEGFCFGVVVGDAIRDLQTKEDGFDWDVDANGDLNIWAGDNRSTDLTGTYTLRAADVVDFSVDLDTANLVTTVSALGSPADPYGPIHDMVRDVNAADTFGRREIVIDVEADEDTRGRLVKQAKAALKAQRGATLTCSATWYHDTSTAPWDFGDVGLQDKVAVNLQDCFTGDQDMKCSDFSVDLEIDASPHYALTYGFSARITDDEIDDTDPDA